VRHLALLLTIAVLAGCSTYAAQRYAISADNRHYRKQFSANEASPQQAAGYQEENLIMMRNHGFSNSSL